MTSPPGSAFCPKRTEHARFLSDTRHRSMMVSKSVRRATASDPMSCDRSTQILTSQSDIDFSLMIIGPARLVSDTKHCPMMSSKSVRRTTVSDPISFYESGQTLTSPSDRALCLMTIGHARCLSETNHCPMVTSKSVCCTTLHCLS